MSPLAPDPTHRPAPSPSLALPQGFLRLEPDQGEALNLAERRIHWLRAQLCALEIAAVFDQYPPLTRLLLDVGPDIEGYRDIRAFSNRGESVDYKDPDVMDFGRFNSSWRRPSDIEPPETDSDCGSPADLAAMERVESILSQQSSSIASLFDGLLIERAPGASVAASIMERILPPDELALWQALALFESAGPAAPASRSARGAL